MLVNASFFAAAVNGLIRIGGRAVERYESALRTVDLAIPPQVVARLQQDQLEVLILDELVQRPELWSAPENPLSRLFRPGATHTLDENTDLDPDERRDLVEMASAVVAEKVWGLPSARDGAGRPLPNFLGVEGVDAPAPLIVLTHKAWADPQRPTVWGELGREIAGVAMGLIAAQPDVVGLRGRTGQFVAGLATQLSALIQNDAFIQANRQRSFGERAVGVFARATLNTLAENPSLALRDTQWAPVVKGFLAPLCKEVNANPRSFNVALDQLERLLAGPMTHGLLQSIADNKAALLTGRMANTHGMGAVFDEILTDLVSVDPATFDIRRTFSGAGAVSVLTSALTAVERQPELFAKGESAQALAKQTFLKSLAATVIAAPPPYNNAAIKPDLIGVVFDTALVFASQRLIEKSGTDAQSSAAADVGAHIVRSIFEGFELVAKGQDRKQVFAGVFDRGFSVDVLKIIATHVARTPGMVVGGNARPEVASFAKSIATMIAADKTGLLHADDWRSLIATACDLAARNPGALFAIRADAAPDQQIAVTLISQLLQHASAGFKATSAREDGRLLFGATLRDALVTTLEAAASVVVRPADAAAHGAALVAFVDRLENLAKSEERTLRMGASEWSYVFRHFAAAILTHGNAKPIPDSEIHAVLLGLDARITAPSPAPSPEEPTG